LNISCLHLNAHTHLPSTQLFSLLTLLSYAWIEDNIWSIQYKSDAKSSVCKENLFQYFSSNLVFCNWNFLLQFHIQNQKLRGSKGKRTNPTCKCSHKITLTCSKLIKCIHISVKQLQKAIALNTKFLNLAQN
jgi:hypothetical protein